MTLSTVESSSSLSEVRTVMFKLSGPSAGADKRNERFP
jgi:hypothetical protein